MDIIFAIKGGFPVLGVVVKTSDRERSYNPKYDSERAEEVAESGFTY